MAAQQNRGSNDASVASLDLSPEVGQKDFSPLSRKEFEKQHAHLLKEINSRETEVKRREILHRKDEAEAQLEALSSF